MALFLHDIFKSAMRRIATWLRYTSMDGYVAARYWRDRHLEYGFDMRGVGNKALSHDGNREMYLAAKEIFLGLSRKLAVDFSSVSMLDVGCGTGFYAGIFRENGGMKYLGIDITDVLFKKLRQRYPDYRFKKLDISTHRLDGCYDLIAMIDVTQHITSQKKFSFAMQNIKNCLSESGVFIVTSWLDETARDSFYEVSRSMDHYRKAFYGYRFSDPEPFRDKFIFSIRK